MNAEEKPQKISIGFHGGQTLAARVRGSELEALRAVLGKSGGWHELRAEDGTISFDLTRVDYLLVESDEHRVGF